MKEYLEMRPTEIIWEYWAEVTSIEEDAERLEIQYLEGK